jgi:starch phosphorylase
MARLFDRSLSGWREDSDYLRRAINLNLDELLDAHLEAKKSLLDEVASRTGTRLNPDHFTIGFARRAASYKRADFVFSDVERLVEVVRQAGQIQFVFAGKAHPQDAGAKAIIQQVYGARERLNEEIPVVYLENHDMALGRQLCAGVDLWLNNPEKPMEASGTSGMKAALNGVPSFSVLDGWWPEGWLEGVTGWSIGNGSEFESHPEEEMTSLYGKLREVIVPMYYNQRTNWAKIMRSAIALNGSYFSTQRMLRQYALNAYKL